MSVTDDDLKDVGDLFRAAIRQHMLRKRMERDAAVIVKWHREDQERLRLAELSASVPHGFKAKSVGRHPPLTIKPPTRAEEIKFLTGATDDELLAFERELAEVN
jgi:hypothetical protein